MTLKTHLIQIFCNQLHQSIGYTFQRELTEKKLQRLSLKKLVSLVDKFQMVQTQTNTLRELFIGPQKNYPAFGKYQLQYNVLFQKFGSSICYKGSLEQWNKSLLAIKKFNKQTAQALEN